MKHSQQYKEKFELYSQKTMLEFEEIADLLVNELGHTLKSIEGDHTEQLLTFNDNSLVNVDYLQEKITVIS